MKYANIASIAKAVLHSANDQLPIFPSAISNEASGTDEVFPSSGNEILLDEQVHLMTRAELKELIRDLHLSQQAAEILGSRMQQ